MSFSFNQRGFVKPYQKIESSMFLGYVRQKDLSKLSIKIKIIHSMKAISNIEFRDNEINFLLKQIEKINDLIALYKANKDDFSINEYTRHRQDFINQLNIQLNTYKLQISEAA